MSRNEIRYKQTLLGSI